MSQYISDNSQRFYQQSYQYTIPQNNFFVLQSQRTNTIRQPSLNRNTNVSSSVILKSGKIQQNICTKLRRQNSLKNSVEYKQNDPYAKNSHLVGHINKVPFNQKDQNDYVSEYDPKNTYCNPLIVKRQKITKDFSRQKIPIHQQTRQVMTQNTKSSQSSKNSIYDKQYEVLNQKISKMQSLLKQNSSSITEHKTKIQRLQEYCQNDNNPRAQQNKRHSRNTSNSSSATPTFKQLSDIMSLIEQSKNYQIKNSQEYRKMIEQFRSTILQFKQELNKTAKKQDIDSQIHKLKQIINVNNLGNSIPRKSSHQYCNSQNLLIQKIEKDITILKSSVQKLQQSNTSIKADMVKWNVRDKKVTDQLHLNIIQANKKMEILQKSLQKQIPFNLQSQCKRGHKYEGQSICFKVSQELITNLKNNGRPSSYPSSRMTHSSVVQYEQGSNIPVPQQKVQSLTLQQKTYYIDKDGYLLDRDNFYLLNDKNEAIKLSVKQIETLRKLKVLE